MDFLKKCVSCTLDNGFVCYFLHRPGPAVELQVHVATGSVHEGDFLGHGLSHFLEHMLFQGCRNYPGHAVADTVTELGGDLNAYTGCDRTCYRMTLPAIDCLTGVNMLASMVQFPELPEERFIQEKEVILRECERSMDNVGNRMFEKFISTMFIRHPLRHPVIGYKELISKVDREMALEYHRLRYTPDRSFMVVVGNVEAAELFDAVKADFGSWARKNLSEIILPQEDVPYGGRNGELIFPDPVSRAMWGIKVPELGDPRLVAMDVLSGMLGTGDGSILNGELVLKQQLALNVRSFCFPLGNCALTGVSMECEPGKLQRAERALDKILGECAAGKISAARMEREKGQQYADRLRSLRNIVGVAGEIAEGVLRFGDPGAGDRYVEQLQKVSIDDVKSCAAEFLGGNRWVRIRQLAKSPKVKSRSDESKSSIEICKLSNGTSVICAADRSLPLCSFALVLPGGTIREANGKAGISQLCASLMSAKMVGMSEETVLKKLDELCVDIDVSSGANSIMLEFSVPKKKFASAVEFMGKLLGKAEFTPQIMERERRYLIERLKIRQVQPVKAALDAMQQLMYGNHPYANGTSGKMEDLQSITLNEVRDFYDRLWNPEKVVIGFAGDCTVEDAEKLAEKFAANITWSNESPELPEKPQFFSGIKREQFTLPREQTVALRSLPGAALDDPETVNAIEILATMENGLGSNLFKVVREDNALSYSVGMTFTSGFHTGTLSFYAMTTPGAGEQVLELFEAEIKRLANGNFSDEEFASACQGAAFESEVSFAKPESLLRSALLEDYYGFDAKAILDKPAVFRSYSREKFSAAMRKLFTSPDGCTVLVLPEE